MGAQTSGMGSGRRSWSEASAGWILVWRQQCPGVCQGKSPSSWGLGKGSLGQLVGKKNPPALAEV